jgi:transposase
MPDIGYLVEELKRPHVTMQLLWVEYREAFPDGYGYTQFCHWIKEQRPMLDVTLRQEHKAGEKVFTDYAGATIPFIDPRTGEVVQTNVFVAGLGPATAELVEKILQMRPHPEQGFRSCLGIINLGKRFGTPRVEAAAKRALAIRSYSYTSVKSILEKRLDSKPLSGQLKLIPASTHANIRGRDYYRS